MKKIIFLKLIILFISNSLYAQNYQLTSCPGYTDPDLPAVRTSPFYFGINGHPFNGYSTYTNGHSLIQYYSDGTPNPIHLSAIRSAWIKQFEHLKYLGLEFYRISFAINNNGEMRWDMEEISPGNWVWSYKYEHRALFKEFCQLAYEYGIKIYLVVDNVNNLVNYTISNQDNYNNGFTQGSQIGNLINELYFLHRPVHIQIGNEILGQTACNNSNANCNNSWGNNINHYNQSATKKVYDYKRGFNIGLKSLYPAAKTFINITNYQYGFLQLVKTWNSQTASPLNYDFISYHWYNWFDKSKSNSNGWYDVANIFDSKYSDNTNEKINIIDQIHAIEPNRKIWVTEYGYISNAVSYNDYNQQEHSKILKNVTRQLYSSEKIEAAFFYELLTNHDIQGHINNNLLYEVFHGLVYCSDVLCNNETRKTIYQDYKYKVAEQKYFYNNYITSYYIDIAGRLPFNQQDVEFWANLLYTTKNTCGVVQELLKYEFIPRYVNDQYLAILGRNADPQGLQNYTDYLRNNNEFETFRASLFDSDEFQTISQNRYNDVPANTAFINNLIRINLGIKDAYEDESTTFTFWINRYNYYRNAIYNSLPLSIRTRLSKRAVTYEMFRSDSYVRNVIKQFNKIIFKIDVENIPNNDYWLINIKNGTFSEHYYLTTMLISEQYKRRALDYGRLLRENPSLQVVVDNTFPVVPNTFPWYENPAPRILVEKSYTLSDGQTNYRVSVNEEDQFTESEKELVVNSELVIYPNPAKDRFTLVYAEKNYEGEIIIDIKNMTGQSVYSSKKMTYYGENFIEVIPQLYNSGQKVYILSVQNKNSVITTRLLFE